MQALVDAFRANPLFTRGLLALATILAAALVVRLINRSLGRVIGDVDARYRSRKIVTLAGYVVAVLAVLAILSDNLPAFGITVGVLGAAVALGLRGIFASVAGWVAIMVGGLFRVGDRVQITGVKGDVIDIGILWTTLMELGEWVQGDLYDGRIVRVTNSAVFDAPVFNYSGDFPFLWDEIRVPVHHSSSHDEARRIIGEVAKAVVGAYAGEARETWERMLLRYRMEAAVVEPLVTMVFDENWMTFTLRYVVDFRRRRSVKDQLFRRILDGFARSQGRVAVASAAMEISYPKGVGVTLEHKERPT